MKSQNTSSVCLSPLNRHLQMQSAYTHICNCNWLLGQSHVFGKTCIPRSAINNDNKNVHNLEAPLDHVEFHAAPTRALNSLEFSFHFLSTHSFNNPDGFKPMPSIFARTFFKPMAVAHCPM